MKVSFLSKVFYAKNSTMVINSVQTWRDLKKSIASEDPPTSAVSSLQRTAKKMKRAASLLANPVTTSSSSSNDMGKYVFELQPQRVNKQIMT